MDNVPWHSDVKAFSEALAMKSSGEYEVACEHAHSCCVLLAKVDKFKIKGEWHTWIDYERFHELVIFLKSCSCSIPCNVQWFTNTSLLKLATGGFRKVIQDRRLHGSYAFLGCIWCRGRWIWSGSISIQEREASWSCKRADLAGHCSSGAMYFSPTSRCWARSVSCGKVLLLLLGMCTVNCLQNT